MLAVLQPGRVSDRGQGTGAWRFRNNAARVDRKFNTAGNEMGNAHSFVNVPPPGTSVSDMGASAETASVSARVAEQQQQLDFTAGIKKGVYRQSQGSTLYVTKNRASPHRCNDRVEDVIQSLFEGNPLLTVPPVFGLLRQCLSSKEGEEPQVPFRYLDLPAPVRVVVPKEETKKRWGW